jgi:hypothetical protein
VNISKATSHSGVAAPIKHIGATPRSISTAPKVQITRQRPPTRVSRKLIAVPESVEVKVSGNMAMPATVADHPATPCR